jgi:hypothetical protein
MSHVPVLVARQIPVLLPLVPAPYLHMHRYRQQLRMSSLSSIWSQQRNISLKCFQRPNRRPRLQLRCRSDHDYYSGCTIPAMTKRNCYVIPRSSIHLSNRNARGNSNATAAVNTAPHQSLPQHTHIIDQCQEIYNSIMDFNNGVRVSRFRRLHCCDRCTFLVVVNVCALSTKLLPLLFYSR